MRNLGLLFVVGEERNSVGAYTAAKTPRGSKFLINGEPTENKLALGSKGALRYEIIAKGRMAHSAYPELGRVRDREALDALQSLRKIKLPSGPGPRRQHDEHRHPHRRPRAQRHPRSAKAEIFIRLVDDGNATRATTCRPLSASSPKLWKSSAFPPCASAALDGFETTVVSYTTDIPAFGGAWGKPFLFGPGTIHVAHTTEERVPKRQLIESRRNCISGWLSDLLGV